MWLSEPEVLAGDSSSPSLTRPAPNVARGKTMGKIKAIFIIPELRQKILLTLLFLAIYRVGYSIPLPFVDQRVMNKGMGEGGGLQTVLNFVSMFSGGDLTRATIFGLGIMP